MTKRYTVKELCRFIDHTNLKPFASNDDILKLCNEAKEYNFKMVAINSVQSKLCSDALMGTDVHVGAAIGFPLGQQTIEVKEFETINAIENGANEIDYVINITEVKNKNYDYIKDEMSRIVNICRKNNVISKVIFENCYLTDQEKINLCLIAKEVKPDFIKTSTGFGEGGATLDDIDLMKNNVGDEVKVKAAGGIRDSKTFIEMIEHGAERIGCSAGIPIINDISSKLKEEKKEFIEI